MSRQKKSRSLKRVTGGVKTGTKEKMKLVNKARKAQKKADNPRKINRQRSVYQKLLDEKGLVETQHVQKTAPATTIEPVSKPKQDTTPKAPEKKKDDLWSQLEQPTGNDIF